MNLDTNKLHCYLKEWLLTTWSFQVEHIDSIINDEVGQQVEDRSFFFNLKHLKETGDFKYPVSFETTNSDIIRVCYIDDGYLCYLASLSASKYTE